MPQTSNYILQTLLTNDSWIIDLSEVYTCRMIFLIMLVFLTSETSVCLSLAEHHTTDHVLLCTRGYSCDKKLFLEI